MRKQLLALKQISWELIQSHKKRCGLRNKTEMVEAYQALWENSKEQKLKDRICSEIRMREATKCEQS